MHRTTDHHTSLGAKIAFPAGQHAEGFTLMATAGSAGYALGSLVVALLPLPPAELISAVLALVSAAALTKFKDPAAFTSPQQPETTACPTPIARTRRAHDCAET